MFRINTAENPEIYIQHPERLFRKFYGSWDKLTKHDIYSVSTDKSRNISARTEQPAQNCYAIDTFPNF
jgi:hypothetical protein